MRVACEKNARELSRFKKIQGKWFYKSAKDVKQFRTTNALKCTDSVTRTSKSTLESLLFS